MFERMSYKKHDCNIFLVNWSIIFCLKNIYFLHISDFFRHFQIKPQLSSRREYTLYENQCRELDLPVKVLGLWLVV